MRRLLILSCVAYLLSCSKPGVNKPVVTDSVVVTNPIVTVPKTPTGIGFDSLKILLKEGTVLQYQRIDSVYLSGWSANDSAKNLAALHWENKRSVPVGYWPKVFRDTSFETITIGGRISFGELPKKMDKATLLYYDSSLTDTSKLTVWWIRNTTWNRYDTMYVYISAKTFWLFTQSAYAPGWSINVPQPPNIRLGLPLKKGFDPDYYFTNSLYSRSDTAVAVRNMGEVQGMYIYAYFSGCTGSCYISSSSNSEIYLSSKLGLIEFISGYNYRNYTYDALSVKVRRILLP